MTNNQYSQRRWFTDGASMDYPGWARTAYWTINLLLYILLNMFVLRIQTGAWFPWKVSLQSEWLIPKLLAPLNIFQFPTYIIVAALLMAMICTVPILIAQLHNILYVIPHLFVVLLFGYNRALSLCLLVSCAAVSFKPLRLKSKFVAAILGLMPVLLYWGLFSGENPQQDVLRWAVLYAPWALAFLVCVMIFGVVLALGHFLRYRPGVLMPIFGLLLAGTVLLFRSSIGMNERDFQADVYRYSPGQVAQFQNRSITNLLEIELAQRQKQFPYLSAELIMSQLRMEWRWAFNFNAIPVAAGEYDAQGVNPISLAQQKNAEILLAKSTSLAYIDRFIDTHPQDPREADALYYKALMIDLKVDSRSLRDENTLRFCHDIPNAHSEMVWRDILNRFSQTDLAVEARWRLARLIAGRKPPKTTDTYNFEEASKLLEQARQHCLEVIGKRKEKGGQRSFWTARLGAIFTSPAPTISDEEFSALQRRVAELMVLIGAENRTGHLEHDERLAKFVGLDPYQLNYESKLKELMIKTPQGDPLQDDIELTLVMLTKDLDQRITQLTELARQYPDRNGGIEAMLELAAALMDQRNRSEHQGDKQLLLEQSRQFLQKVIVSRPDSFYAQHAQQLLSSDQYQLK